ncbi:hypothetical protein H6P81_021640 [Aristolochia fimbriata]|uniref:Uncharacterized protein n=1 Tax=Aristolochia fimbriata TaxID=158543 RepID=A0AAV7DQF4_ARIFI|nr:hypothetical protein H6P81_021640 [Aristolochia fimbriata]
MGTFFPYHYITYGNRQLLVIICLRKWVDNEILAVVISSLKIKELFFPYHYITLWKRTALWWVSAKWVDNEIHGYGVELLH